MRGRGGGNILEPLHAGDPCCCGPGSCTVLFRLPSGLGLLILACGRALQCHAGFELGLLILAIGRVLLLPQPDFRDLPRMNMSPWTSLGKVFPVKEKAKNVFCITRECLKMAQWLRSWTPKSVRPLWRQDLRKARAEVKPPNTAFSGSLEAVQGYFSFSTFSCFSVVFNWLGQVQRWAWPMCSMKCQLEISLARPAGISTSSAASDRGVHRATHGGSPDVR